MVPIVKIVMCLCYPISYPIAKVLDKFLHDDEGDDGAFDRGEISALVRIQYEERIANKRQRKLERMSTARLDSSDSSAKFFHPKKRPHDLVLAMKAASASFRTTSEESAEFSVLSDVQSIHVDEVMMVEGALQMKTKLAMDHFTPIHRMFAVPENLILNEDSVVDIYSSGYSRIPVYEHNPLKPKSQTAIKGLLLTKHLIVVNMNEDRPLLTMPLLIPPCVSPKMNLVELVNLFQTGKSGHFALVCARPSVGNKALRNGNAVPAAAGVMG
jgi:metal transporter CNNM